MNIFISSVQKEFANERNALGEYLAGDALLRRIFKTFLFERDIPAIDRHPEEIYLNKVAECDIYLGIFGAEYGLENEDGFSPTHLEFNEATRLNKLRFIYVKGSDDKNKHPKIKNLINQADNHLIRRRFSTTAELRTRVYASLVSHLITTGIINQRPWDVTADQKATIDDIDSVRITNFVHHARKVRGFPLPLDTNPRDVLTHLNLLEGEQPTHAAVLLFAHDPQRFMLTTEVKCAHFHGTETAKPIPSYQVYKGTASELIDQSIDFILSKINVSVGTRAEGSQTPIEYEIPRDVVSEAIINAVAHRDYTSNGSVQVMLFSDRLEVWNPGTLPPSLTLDKLRETHGSFPHNPLLAESLYLMRYIERMGTGTGDMIRSCVAAGLPEPDFRLTDGFTIIIYRHHGTKAAPSRHQVDTKSALSQHQVGTKSAPSQHQVGTKSALNHDRVETLRNSIHATNIKDLMKLVDRIDRTKFRNTILKPLIAEGLIEMTIPEKPTSSNQKYRTTKQGHILLEQLKRDG